MISFGTFDKTKNRNSLIQIHCRKSSLSTGMKDLTKLIWANSYLIGCDTAGIENQEELKMSTVQYVCYMAPKGEKPGQTIFTGGQPCGICPKHCSSMYSGLCKTNLYRKRYFIDHNKNHYYLDFF